MQRDPRAPALCEFSAGHSSDPGAPGPCPDRPWNVEGKAGENDKRDRCPKGTRGGSQVCLRVRAHLCGHEDVSPCVAGEGQRAGFCRTNGEGLRPEEPRKGVKGKGSGRGRRPWENPRSGAERFCSKHWRAGSPAEAAAGCGAGRPGGGAGPSLESP